MVAKLIERNGVWYCSNCMMKQPQPQDKCWWCDYIFSNIEEVLIKDVMSQYEEAIRNESNIHGRD